MKEMKTGFLVLAVLAAAGCHTTTSTEPSSSDSSTQTPVSGDDAGTAANTRFDGCTFAGIERGSEGETCRPTWNCTTGGRYAVSCSLAAEDYECTCDVTQKTFIMKLTPCESLADPDAVNELCGVSVSGGDGQHKPITVVARHEDPVFSAPDLHGCGPLQAGSASPTVPIKCEWTMACDGPVTLSVTCNEGNHGLDCLCTINGKTYQVANPVTAKCESFNRAAIIKLCSFPVIDP